MFRDGQQQVMTVERIVINCDRQWTLELCSLPWLDLIVELPVLFLMMCRCFYYVSLITLSHLLKFIINIIIIFRNSIILFISSFTVTLHVVWLSILNTDTSSLSAHHIMNCCWNYCCCTVLCTSTIWYLVLRYPMNYWIRIGWYLSTNSCWKCR